MHQGYMSTCTARLDKHRNACLLMLIVWKSIHSTQLVLTLRGCPVWFHCCPSPERQPRRTLCGHPNSSGTVLLTCSKAQGITILSLEQESRQCSAFVRELRTFKWKWLWQSSNFPLYFTDEADTERLSEFPKTTQLHFIRAQGNSRSPVILSCTLPPHHAALSQETSLMSPTYPNSDAQYNYCCDC